MAKGKRNMRRKTHRKGTRKSRHMKRMRGGQLMGSNVEDNSMKAASNISLEQGGQYAKMHSNQHGGVADLSYTGALPAGMRAEARVGQMGGMAPVGDTGVLEAGLRESARIQPLDASLNEIAGMRDQGGGGRKSRKSRKSNKRKSHTKKSKSHTKMRKSRRKMRGGMADVGSPDMLLSGDMASKAVGGMNPEWKLAENPNSFSPLTQ